MNIDSDPIEYKEIRFKTYKDVSEFLSIPLSTVKTMVNNKLQCNFPKHQHLKGIKVERQYKEKLDDSCKDALSYQKSLLDKINNS